MGEESIKISVIVITYNQEATIGRTLDSILEQKVNVPFEIIIGDDCSHDNTERICREYEKSFPDKIRYFRREENLGVVRNYFQCIDDSRGEFLADCAGDDFWVDNAKLQMEYDIMQADPEISLVHTDWLCCNLDGSNVRRSDMFAGIDRSQKAKYNRGELLTAIFQRRPEAFIHLCSAMYRADIIKNEVRLHPELYVCPEYGCEDFQIIAAMAALGRIVYLPHVTLHYSISDTSVSHHGDFSRKYRQVKGTLNMILRLSDYYNINPKDLSKYYADTQDYLCAQVFHSGSSDLLKDYKRFVKNSVLSATRSHKTKIRELIMSVNPIWKLMLQLIGKRGSR